MALIAGLPHFALHEFKHPELVDFAAAQMLEEVRERYGKPLVLTSDARTLAEEVALPNHATPPESSLHVQGRAFDLRWAFDTKDLYHLIGAVYAVCHVHGVEAEIEPRGAGFGPTHMHIGFFQAGHPGAFLL